MFRTFSLLLIGALITIGESRSAAAHVSLVKPEAPTNSQYRAALKVGHGCGGSPTLRLRVRIPEGVIAIKPTEKPGWTTAVVEGDYKQTYTFNGAGVSRGAKEISWSGTLPDGHRDEFVFEAYLTEDLRAGDTLYFPTVQECEKGVERWIETPSPGRSSDDVKDPAPALKLLPAAQKR